MRLVKFGNTVSEGTLQHPGKLIISQVVEAPCRHLYPADLSFGPSAFQAHSTLTVHPRQFF